MRTINKIITFCIALMLFAALSTNISYAGKPTGGGKGGKVTVEAATPNSVIQTKEADVTITGTGFDDGSTVRFLVTGTDDGTQIVVDPLKYEYIDSKNMKVHITTTGSTLPVDYDIEVQAVSGRKGKGTTLFKVQKEGDVCVDTEFPTIVFLTQEQPNKGRFKDPKPYDFVLTGDGGCTRSILLSQYANGGGHVKLSIRGENGVVTWLERLEDANPDISTYRIMALLFDVQPGGSVTPDAAGPVVLKEVQKGAGEDVMIRSQDTWLDENGELLIVYRHEGGDGSRKVRILNPQAGTDEIIASGECSITDIYGECYRVGAGFAWSPDGNSIYMHATLSEDVYVRPGIARIVRDGNTWLPPELVVVDSINVGYGLDFGGVAIDGRIAYRFPIQSQQGTTTQIGIINPEDCVPAVCEASEGMTSAAVDGYRWVVGWTGSGSLLFWEDNKVKEWSDPDLAIESDLLIEDATGRGQMDTSL